MRIAAALAALSLAIPAFSIPPVPRPSKEFTIFESTGKQILLTSLKGKVVYLQFLSTSCPHCQALSRDLEKIQKDLGPQGLQVIGVAFDEANAQKAADYKTKMGVTFPVGFASHEAVLSYLGLSVMERISVPQIVVVDRKGAIRAQSQPMTSPELHEVASIRKLLTGLLTEKR